jgi:hypothetical protein
MTETNFRALCAELLDELELWSSWHDAADLKDRAAAALHFDQAEPQPPVAIVEMVNKLYQINNPAIQSVAPTDEELYELWEESGFESDRFARAVLTRWGTLANNTREEN